MPYRPQHSAKQPRPARTAVTVIVAVGALLGAAPFLPALSGSGFALTSTTPQPVGPVEPAPVRDAEDPRAAAERLVPVVTEVKPIEQAAKEPAPDLSTMSVDQLQTEAAKMQAEFVQASLAYEAAEDESVQAQVAAEEAEVEAAEAAEDEQVARDQFSDTLAIVYMEGPAAEPLVAALTQGEDSVTQMSEDLIAMAQVTDAHIVTVDELDEASARADRLSDQADRMREAAVTAEAKAETLLADIQKRASKVATAANAALASAAEEGLFADAEQQARNQAALKAWRAYLKRLDRAHVVPPTAAQLRSPRRLPRGLKAFIGTDGKPVAGVAAVTARRKTLTVLPEETITAVSQAFAYLGKPYVNGNVGPDTFDCAGLAVAAWDRVGLGLPVDPVDQFRSRRAVPVSNPQVGDLVFFDAADAGIQHVGLNLGGNLMLTADAVSNQVGVQEFPAVPYAAARVTLPAGPGNTVPVTDPDSPLRCGGTDVPASAAGMVSPIKEGTFRFTSTFGAAGPYWASGYHTGLDFAAPLGTAVVAAKAGTVSLRQLPWAGTLVTIDHGDGLATAYAHMSSVIVKAGATVAAGELIGTVGAQGNATGPHLHFEVLIGGIKVDPMVFLVGDGASSTGWGGFTNGMIPDTALCGLQSAPGHKLRCDAAHAFDAMARAFTKATGSTLCITDSYRSYVAQVQTYADKPTLAAVPGTSNHGWALAVDLCGGIERFGSPAHSWMVRNADRFGWVLPDWAQSGGSKPEPWHWEFGNIS